MLLFCVAAVAGCDRLLPKTEDRTLPDVSAVEQLYVQHGLDAGFRFSGNVVEIEVQQDPDELRRGGSLWARVGPYIYLFTPGTRQVLEQFPGIAGVRVITMAGNEEVARALLVRNALNDITWPRAHNLLGTALEQGTTRPLTMDQLAQFGEEVTEYRYNPRFAPQRQ
ncbi:MAG: hypothetical protein WD054_04545 [Gemmatimonadota bacterium]